MMQRPYKPFERIEWLPRPRDIGIPMPPSPFFTGKVVKAREPIMVSVHSLNAGEAMQEVPRTDATPYVSVRRARPEIIGIGGRGREKYLAAHPELRKKLEAH